MSRVARGVRLAFAAGTSFVVFLFIIIFVASAMRAHRYAKHGGDDDDRGGDGGGDDHRHTHHRRSLDIATATTENEPLSAMDTTDHVSLNELRVLNNLKEINAEDLVNDHWLPIPQEKARPSRRNRRHATSAAATETDTQHLIDLRENAERISHDTYYLGEHDHPTIKGQKVHGYAFVHYHAHSERAKQTANRDSEDRAKFNYFNRSHDEHGGALKLPVPAVLQAKSRYAKRDAEEALEWKHIGCAAPIRHGARMRHSAGYYIHTDNGSRLKSGDVVAAVEEGMDTWRCVFKKLQIEPLGPLLGVIERDSPNEQPITFDRPTGENHIGFGTLKLPDGGEDETLGITVSFGIFDAHRSEDRFLAEFKTIYNDDYEWGLCKENPRSCLINRAIDLQSIAVHESGHAFGLDDLYANECKHATMYWSSPPGDTSKRSLEEDDVNGMLALYR